jgi:endoglucanase
MRLRTLAPALAILVTLAASASSSAQAPDPQGAAPGSPNPLAGLPWFVDHEWGPAWREHRHLLKLGRRGEAGLMLKLAEQPQFKWFGRSSGTASPYRTMRGYFERMDQSMPGAVPQIVSMRHEGNDCGPHYTGGGARGDELTRSWWRGFARAVGDRRVVIAFEPDSLGTVGCLAASRQGARLRLLREGVDILSALPNATIYLDAGASDWQGPAETARKLRAIGVDKVRGFMLNATHMDWTAANIRHGLKVSHLVGGKPFIINTSHNGNGAVHYRRWIDRSRHLWRQETVWCNPPNSAAGSAPTTNTANPKVDAYLWVERPGYSNGRCNGGPKTGVWWPERALALARRAHW